MNPVLQSVREALAEVVRTKQAEPPQKPFKLPPAAQQTGSGLKPLLGVISAALDTIDVGIGTGLQAPTQVAYKLSKGQRPDIEPVRATDIAGEAAARLGGEGARGPAAFGTSLLLPPWGLGGVLKGVKTAKLSDLAKFGDEAAKLTKAEEIATLAEKSFPGITRETAENLGKQFEKVSDPLAIKQALTTPLSGATRERGFATSVRETLPKIGAQLPEIKYTVRPTTPLAIAAKNLVRDNLPAAEIRAVSQTGDDAVAIGSELLKRYDDQALLLERQNKLLEANALRDKAAELTNTMARNLTEAGRYVQAASILSRQTPEGIARFVARNIQKFNEGKPPGRQIPELSGQLRRELVEEWRRIQKIENVDDKARAIDQFTQKVANLTPDPLYRRMVAVWKAGLLTGLKTTGLNIMSNAHNAFFELLKEVPAAVVERTVYGVTRGKFGKPTIALTARGVLSGAREGFQKGARYLKTGYDERNILDKFDMRRVSFGTSPMAKAIQKYEESIFRWMGAQDQPFYYGAKARSIISQAIAKGKGLGLRGVELRAYVNKLVENPTDDIIKYATLDAETVVFQNSTALGKLGQAFQRAGLEFVIPFAKTPAAVAMQVVNYSPAGVVAEIARQIKRGTFDQRLFSQAMGRAVTGTGLMYLGTELYKKGMMALTYPQSATERNQWELEGRTPNSFKIGDAWRTAAVFGPQGLAMLIGGHFAKAMDEEGSPTAAILRAVAGLGKTLTEQTFLKGTNDLSEVLNDPYTQGVNYFSGYVGSIIPTIVSDVARATDTSERRFGEGAAGGLFDRLWGRIPGVRQSMLEPKITALGSVKLTPEWWETMIDPMRPSKVSKDPVVIEMRRLWDAGFAATPTKLGKGKKGYASLTPEQNTDLWVLSGELLHQKLEALLKLSEYKELPDEQKQKAITQFTEIAKRMTRAQIIYSLTQGLSGQDLARELARHKDSGLLTQEVFKEYVKLNPDLEL